MLVARRPYLIQEANEFFHLYVVKVLYNFFILGAAAELIKSGRELPGGYGGLIQTAELTGNECRVGSSFTEIHGSKSEQNEIWGSGRICYIMPE